MSKPNSCDGQQLYLDLMKKCLTDMIYQHVEPVYPVPNRIWYKVLFRVLNSRGLDVINAKLPVFDAKIRAQGLDWPKSAHTMIGIDRLNNIQFCVEDVIRSGVPGDLIEAGVWRGGATIFMRAILKAYGIEDRTVWVADSFEGLPPPDTSYPADAGDLHSTFEELAVTLEEVQSNFDRYGLLDDQVRFLEGWFRDTLTSGAISQIAVMRIDGDMYGSTIEALSALYPKLAVGGYVIIDDFVHKPCRSAVEDYRAKHSISEEISSIDWTGVYWKRCS